jgi:hypothetical protein
MAVSRLSIYQGALRECQERKLGSLSEDCESRRLLDDVWNDGDGLLRFVLRQKQWRFARRSVEIASEASIEPAFGYQYAFAQPSDFVRTTKICSDERLQLPILDYDVEAGYWYCDIDPMYVSYVSDDADYGGNLSGWPPDFVLYVETHLAAQIAGRLTGAKSDRNDLLKLAKIRLNEAVSADAMEGPTVFPPVGSWVRSRGGRRDSRLDRGSRSRLIG